MLIIRCKKGFTLIELAISLTIMGLIVAGGFAGLELIRVAERRAIITEVEQYKIAVDNFITQYEGFPGDLENASSFWGSTSDGDGNGKIDNTDVGGGGVNEYLTAWQQLYLARLIEVSLTGAGSDAIIGTNVPASNRVENIGYSLRYHTGPGSWADDLNRNFKGHYIILATDANDGDSTTLRGAALKSEYAYLIDKKLDDGQPDYGDVLGVNGHGVTGCTTATAPSDAEYDFSSDVVKCRVYFHINSNK